MKESPRVYHQVLLLAIAASLAIHTSVLFVLYLSGTEKRLPEETFVLDMDAIELEEPISVPELPIEDGLSAEVRNFIANRAAERSNEETHYSRRSEEKMEQDVYEKLKNLEKETFDKLRQEREQEMNNVEPDSSPTKKETKKEENKEDYSWYGKEKSYSAATVEFDLSGREARHLPAPAYRCKGNGIVIIAVEVNEGGDVIKAEVLTSTASSECLNEEAVAYALKSRFSSKAGLKKQSGKLTYRFVAQ
jgi:TonB family protein